MSIPAVQSTKEVAGVPVSKRIQRFVFAAVAIVFTTVVFWVPFYFVIINSFKTPKEAALMGMGWPGTFQIAENYMEVLSTSNYLLLQAFYNSSMLTLLSIVLLVLISSMAGFVLQRRESGRASSIVNFLILAGLMIPPAIVPTIWVLEGLGLFKTMAGITFIEAAIRFPFACILYRAFMATLPRELDESAFIDGCGGVRLFTSIIFPLLKPVTSTIVVLSAIQVFNDFVHPLYFFPGNENATVQLTLYNFMSRYMTQWNLLFADVVLISIPPLILFLIFNKRIVAGMTAGAIKG